jgi:hypothetical protein
MAGLLKRRSLLAISIMLGATSPWTMSKEPSNILVILTDDLDYGDLGFAGSQEINTPATPPTCSCRPISFNREASSDVRGSL